MIYIIKQPSFKDGYINIKVGYSENIKRRLDDYLHHCSETMPISVRAGEIEFEQVFHAYLRALGPWVDGHGEWYRIKKVDLARFLNEFHRPTRYIESRVLKLISDCQKKTSIPVSRTAFDYLNSKYKFYTTIDDNIEMDSLSQDAKDFVRRFMTQGDSCKRLQMLSEDLSENIKDDVFNTLQIFEEVKLFIKFGPDICKKSRYRLIELRRLVSDEKILNGEFIPELHNHFEIGKRYSLRDIKETLDKIYTSLGIYKSPKAVDLKDYFEVKEIDMYTFDGDKRKRSKGYLILSIK